MLTSPGLLINSTVFILTNIVNSTLYIESSANVIECYISLDYNNSFNDSWPAQWQMMKVENSALIGNRCSYPLSEEMDAPPDFFNYKVKYRYMDGSVRGLDDWQTILWKVEQNEGGEEIVTKEPDANEAELIKVLIYEAYNTWTSTVSTIVQINRYAKIILGLVAADFIMSAITMFVCLRKLV